MDREERGIPWTPFLALTLLGIILLTSLIGPLCSSYFPSEIHLSLKNLPPSSLFWFGSDELGRDLFTRLCHGGRISLSVACLATLIDLFVGVLWGSIAAYAGGKTEEILMRFCDIFHAIPFLLIVIFCNVLLGAGFSTVLLSITLTGWTQMARIVRGQVLQLKQLEFILAARSLGASFSRLLMYHLLPNAMGPILAAMALTIPSAIFAESFLSFLGLGIQAPEASWGTMVNDGLGALSYYPWRLFLPAGAITLTMLSFNLLGNGLRDLFKVRPRMLQDR